MLTPRQIHERIAAHLEASLASPTVPGAWRESRAPFDLFPSVDSAELEHHGFAIGLPSSVPREEDRQRTGTVWTTTTVSIRWAHRLRVDATVFDTLAALDAEGELTRAARRVESNPSLHVDVTGWSRATSRDGLLFLGQLDLRVVHLYPV